ncbi:MAG: universal stress protein [Acidobacteria bacterium]|nr:universal stress protein [Acidobacteriota bacterium]
MLKIKKILVPTDFSSQSSMVAAHARVLALQSGAEVVVAHCMRPFHLAVEGVDVPAHVVTEWYAEQKPRIEKQLAEFANIYFKDMKVRTVFAEGEPAGEIIEVAKREEADLIMISTHGYGAFRRFLLGSIAAKILHDSPVPVLTSTHVDAPASATEQIRTIVVAVDLSPRSPLVIANAAALAREFGAKLHVVHATPDEGDGAARYLDHAWRDEIARKVAIEIETYIRQGHAEADTVHVISGKTEEVVKQVAGEVEADLVVIGCHHSHGYNIVRTSPAPVLSLGMR